MILYFESITFAIIGDSLHPKFLVHYSLFFTFLMSTTLSSSKRCVELYSCVDRNFPMCGECEWEKERSWPTAFGGWGARGVFVLSPSDLIWPWRMAAHIKLRFPKVEGTIVAMFIWVAKEPSGWGEVWRRILLGEGNRHLWGPVLRTGKHIGLGVVEITMGII